MGNFIKTRNVNHRRKISSLMSCFAATQLLVLNSNNPVFSASSASRTVDQNKSGKNTVAHRLAVRNLALVLATQHSDVDAVQKLLKSGADPNSKDKSGTPALFFAVGNKQLTLTKMLLDAGATVDGRDARGATAILLAFGQSNLMRLLLERGANPNVRFPRKKHKNDMSLPDDMTLLMGEVWIGEPENVRLLLRKGARVNDGDVNGWNALTWVAARQRPGLGDSNAASVANILLDNGANANARTKAGDTPLMMAARFLKKDVIRVLVKRGAKVNEKNQMGETALMLAVARADELFTSKREGLAAIKLLLDNGADINIADNRGDSALTRTQFFKNRDLEILLKTRKIPAPPARLLSRPKALMPQAKPLLAWNRNCLDYRWKSSKELLVLRSSQIGDIFYDYWFVHDLKTGRERKVPSSRHNNSEVVFSPDGNWILTAGEFFSGKLNWKVSSFDSKRVFRGVVPQATVDLYNLPYFNVQSWTWAPDNKRWIWAPESLGDNQMPVVILSLNSSKVREIKVAVQNKDEMLPAIILGFTSPNRVLSTSGTSFYRSSTRSDLHGFDISAPKPKARRIEVNLPVRCKARPLLSPRGDKILWVLQVEDGARDSIEFWLSRNDGTQMRGVGFVEAGEPTDGFSYDKVQWRPDGKQITFVKNEKIYAVNVPK